MMPPMSNTNKSVHQSTVGEQSSKAVLLLVLTISVGINIRLLIKQEYSPRDELQQVDPSSTIGSSLRSMELEDIHGETRTISLERNKPTVLYIFNPSCKWCEQNLANIETLASQRHDEYHFIGVAITRSGLEDYLKHHMLMFKCYGPPSSWISRALAIKATPQTLVISKDGKIIHNWVGAFVNTTSQQVEAEFKMKLPGLSKPLAATPNKNVQFATPSSSGH